MDRGALGSVWRRAFAWFWVLLCGAGAAFAALGQLARWWPWLDFLNSAMPYLALVAGSGVLVALIARRRARLLLVLSMAGLVLSCERILPELTRPIATASLATGRDVRILTFNTFRDNAAPLATIRAILAKNPDVVLMQEASRVFALHDPAFERAFPYRSRCPRDHCDPAVMSRWPLTQMHYRFRDARGEPDGSPLVQAIVHPDDARPPFAVASTHLPRPTQSQAQAEYALLAQTISRYATPRLVLSGDFNLTPWSFALQSLDKALRPMTRATRANRTYPGNRAIAGLPVPPLIAIDQMYVGPLWLVRSVETLPSAGSDHRGLLVILQPIMPSPKSPARPDVFRGP